MTLLHTAIYTYMNIAIKLEDVMQYLYKKSSDILKNKIKLHPPSVQFDISKL